MSPETFLYVFTQHAAVTFEPATRWHRVIFGCSLVALPICGARLVPIIPGMRQHQTGLRWFQARGSDPKAIPKRFCLLLPPPVGAVWAQGTQGKSILLPKDSWALDPHLSLCRESRHRHGNRS